MHTEGSSSPQPHDSCRISENQSCMIKYSRQQGAFVDLHPVIVTMQRSKLIQCFLELLRREHITHVQRNSYSFTCMRSLHFIFPASLSITISAKSDAPFATNRLQPVPIRIVRLYRERNVFSRQIRVCHDTDLFSATGISRQVLSGKRNTYPKLLKRQHLFERHKHELFIISINIRPDSYVFQRSGAIKAELEIMIVVQLNLQRLSDIETALARIEINIRRFFIVQQIIRIILIIGSFRHPDGQFFNYKTTFIG